MKTSVNIDNRIFKYALVGVLLLIAAMAFTLNNFSQIATFQMSSLLVASTLGFSSFSLLGKAIKKDNDRLKKD